eukprot:g58910.t1
MRAAAGKCTLRALSWQQLEQVANRADKHRGLRPDLVNGVTSPKARLRLFGLKDESQVRVTFYRDHHAWCPYCQKIWLFLEEKKIPYRVSKVTMFCYGQKEDWYKEKVPNGMLPAIQLDGRLITESDVILMELERAFGPLQASMNDKVVVKLRKLERALFSAWCRWLCYPAHSAAEEKQNQESFEEVAGMVDAALAQLNPHTGKTSGYFLGDFSVVDCVFVPYVERMSASLYYYKGFTLRHERTYPHLARWFDAMESRSTYRAMQSDFHTHSHDLPPQMGGCYENGQAKQKECKMRVDRGPFVGGGVPDALYPEPADSRMQALAAMLKHRESLMRVNPYHGSQALEPAVRAALTTLVQDAKQSGGEEPEAIELEAADAEIAANALRYIRDRVNVPRDMPDINVPRDMPDRVNVPRDMPVWSLIECLDRVNVPRDMPVWSARRLREALELTAAQCNHPEQAESEHPIQLRHRRDQNPAPFGAQGLYKRERATA